MIDNKISKDVFKLTCPPIPLVKVGMIGLGKRGKELLYTLLHIDNVEIKAICDTKPDSINDALQMMGNGIKPQIFYKNDDWKAICQLPDIDLIYICTDRFMHATIAINAMKCGKHVAVEVPAANTLDECYAIVETAEQTQKHCFMLENCCFSEPHLIFTNMYQKGILGEIFHLEGAYIHDLRQLDFQDKPHYLELWRMEGNPYPTHGLGPMCQLLDIHRNDYLESLVSVSSAQMNTPHQNWNISPQTAKLGNINTTIFRTQKGKTIVLQHDVSSPRPYSRRFVLSGTKAFIQNDSIIEIALGEKDVEFLSQEQVQAILKKYEHSYFKEKGELAKQIGRHEGMDFMMNYRLIFCLQNGLPLDIDVYDAAEWCSVIELSAISVRNNSQSIQIPRFLKNNY